MFHGGDVSFAAKTKEKKTGKCRGNDLSLEKKKKGFCDFVATKIMLAVAMPLALKMAMANLLSAAEIHCHFVCDSENR